MGKCTFCNHRLEAGLEPACVDACPTTALTLGTRADAAGEPEGSTGLGLLDWGLGPALVVRSGERSGGSGGCPAAAGGSSAAGASSALGASPAAGAPVAAGVPVATGAGRPGAAIGPRQPVPPRKIRLSPEWTLLLFTLAIPTLLAWLAAGLADTERAAAGLGGRGAWAFIAAGGLAMGLSALHLGRPLRAWRAILNLRTSPLSREIALSSAFLGTGAVHLLLPEGSALRLAAGVLAVIFGAGALVAIDSVYRAIPRAGRPSKAPPLRSADAWLTGALLVGLAVQVPLAWAPAALLKLLLGLRERTLPAPLVALRLILLAAATVLAATGTPWTWPFLTALAGEVLDRAGFYHQLEPASPGRTMAAQLTAAARS